jgi:beta-glucosidase-like glycosyl hydrolase
MQSHATAGVGSYMCSYNKIDGIWAWCVAISRGWLEITLIIFLFCSENDETLNKDLKGTLGFEGFVMR